MSEVFFALAHFLTAVAKFQIVVSASARPWRLDIFVILHYHRLGYGKSDNCQSHRLGTGKNDYLKRRNELLGASRRPVGLTQNDYEECSNERKLVIFNYFTA